MTPREIDAIVAEKVTGWREIYVNGEYYYPDRPKYFNCPNYSTDISAAWSVVEKFEGWAFEITALRKATADCWDSWMVRISGKCSVDAIEKTAPLAICRAALKAHGIEI